MATEFARRLFTVEDYHRMVEAGILTSDDRVELIGGEIVEMTPIGPAHAGCVTRLAQNFIQKLAGRAAVRIQSPVILDDLSEPEPDVSVCHPRADYYSEAHPRPEDLYLVIEVADTSMRRDRVLKLPRYARAGVPEVWLFDLEADHIEVYRGPGPDGYAERTIVRRGETLAPEAFPDVRLGAADLLG